MDPKSLADDALIEKVESLAHEERAYLTAILLHLREIERRRLFSALGFKSLFEFTVKHLSYSEDQAYRRIVAMRLLRELPEIEGKVRSGELSLSHMGIAQTLFRREELSKDQKLEVLESIAGKSIRDTEKLLLAKEQIELRVIISEDVQQKFETLRGLFPALSAGELFGKLCELGLAEWYKNSPATSQKQRDVVRRRAGNKCENCGSTFALEIDHIVPVAKGGTSVLENLRLLCRSCNQRKAIEAFGVDHMGKFIS